MRTKLTVLAFSLSAVMASTAFAGDIKPLHGGFLGSLGTAAGATDIIRFRCGTQAGINQGLVKVLDRTTIVDPNLKVEIATSTATTCGAYHPVSASTSSEGVFSASAAGPIAATSGGYYCVKVTKIAGNNNPAAPNGTVAPNIGVGADQYELDHHCQNSANPAAHPSSTLVGYFQNQ